MTERKQLWLLAGGNGSGKSTFYERYLKPQGMPFVNADVIARELYPEAPEAKSYVAARIADDMRAELLRKRRNFCFETVFSHPSKIDFVAQAKALDYEVVLVFIHLDNPDLNNARVSQRVEAGGHHVPDDKVRERIPRTLENIKVAMALCDRITVLDNSRYDDPYRPIATIEAGQLRVHARALPEWAWDLLGDYL